MRISRVAFFVCFLAAVTSITFAQDVLQVDAKTIQQYIDHQIFPIYPPIAKAARIQGTVVLDLRIGTTGKVESVKAVSGPAMLQQAAIDCVKQWTFHHFEKDGVPAIATGPANIIFALGDQSSSATGREQSSSAPSDSSSPPKTVTVHVLSDNAATGPNEELNKKFNEADDACKKGILSKQFNDATTSSCKNAAELAEKLAIDGNYVAKRSAFVYAATAYGDVGDFESALPWADKAVEVVKLGHDDDSGSSAAYAVRGQLKALLGDPVSADGDLTEAENFDREAIESFRQRGSEDGGYIQHDLIRNLQIHAKVLQALGRPDEAQKKLDEAAKHQ